MKKYIMTLILILCSGANAKDLSSFYLDSTSRILFAGESHINDRARDIFSDSLQSFKDSGGDTLGLEMVESHKQYLLDNFLEERENSEFELYEYLRVRWQYNTKNYMKLITRAKSLELKLLAIDLDKRKWPAETALYPVPPDISKIRVARETHMAKLLCRADFQRIIVIIGSFHSLKEYLPSGLRNECYADSATFDITSL